MTSHTTGKPIWGESENPILWAWCAGYLDAKGSFLLVPTGSTYTNGTTARKPRIVSEHTHLEPLQHLQDTLGGTIASPGGRARSDKQVYIWRLTDRPALRVVLRRLMPLLTVTAADAALCLELAEQPAGKPFQKLTPKQEAARVEIIQRYMALSSRRKT